MTTATGISSSAAIDLVERYGAHNYHPLPVVAASADGAWVTDPEGNRYLDCLAAYSAVNFGHGHPVLLAAAREQLDRVTLTSRAFHSDRLGPFLEALARLAKKDMVLPMNTGAEAVESAIKVARAWGYRVKGVAADRAQARKLFEQAAARGNAKAMRNLGYMYYFGEGVERDPVRQFVSNFAYQTDITPSNATFAFAGTDVTVVASADGRAADGGRPVGGDRTTGQQDTVPALATTDGEVARNDENATAARRQREITRHLDDRPEGRVRERRGPDPPERQSHPAPLQRVLVRDPLRRKLRVELSPSEVGADERDVVRHQLVQQIVKAYEAFQAGPVQRS